MLVSGELELRYLDISSSLVGWRSACSDYVSGDCSCQLVSDSRSFRPVRRDLAEQLLTHDISPMTMSEMVSGGRAVEQMTVLRYRPRKDREVDLAVIVDRHDTHDRFRRFVAGEQHCSGPHTLRSASVGQRRPAEAVIVLRIQICDHIEFVEYHGEVTTVSTCRFKPNADAPQRSYGYDRQLSEPNQR